MVVYCPEHQVSYLSVTQKLEVCKGTGTVETDFQHSVDVYLASFTSIPESQPGHSKSCQSKGLGGVRSHRRFSRYVFDKGRNDPVAHSPDYTAASDVQWRARGVRRNNMQAADNLADALGGNRIQVVIP